MSQPQRLANTRAALRQRGLDALFVSQPLNVYYLSAFRPMMWNIVQPTEDPEGYVLVQPNRVAFICDDRYDPAPATAGGATHQRLESPAGHKSLAAAIRAQLAPSAKRVGYEAASLLHADATALFELIPEVEWVRADDLLVQQRICKDHAELQLLQDAARITDDAFTHATTVIREGMTEHQLADEISTYLRRHSDGCSFNTIVAFGPNAAAPHYEPSHDRRLARGDLILMDFGACYKGYMGDMTRMAVFGKATDKHKRVYNWVLQAQQAVLDGLRPGMPGHAADKLARDVFERLGVLDRFLHGTGHGIGLAIHEPPRLKVSFDNPLLPGTVFSVEPGLYEPGWGGVRIEDVVYMDHNGPVNLTASPKATLLELN